MSLWLFGVMADVSARMSVSHRWPRPPPDWPFWVSVCVCVCYSLFGGRLRRERMEMSPIHPSAHDPPGPPRLAYGMALSLAAEPEVMQFVGMSCHLTNYPSHWGLQKTRAEDMEGRPTARLRRAPSQNHSRGKITSCIHQHVHTFLQKTTGKHVNVFGNVEKVFALTEQCKLIN